MSLPVDVLEIIFGYDDSLWKVIENSYKRHKKNCQSGQGGYSETIIILERHRLKLYYWRKINNAHRYHYSIYINKKTILRDIICIKNQSVIHGLLKIMFNDIVQKVPLIRILKEII